MNQPAAEEPPILALDPAQRDAWTRQALVLAGLLRASRLRAWAGGEAAARDHDAVVELAARPPRMLPLPPAEREQWSLADQRRVEQREVVFPDHGQGIRVRVGPLADGRWGVDSQVHTLAPDGSLTGEPLSRHGVACESEQAARDLAGDILTAKAPEDLTRLADNIAARAARHAEAGRQVREDPRARSQRIRSAIREHWHPELAAKVLYDRHGQPNEAFDAMVARLHQLEEQGIPLATALDRVDQDRLLGRHVRNPAALAAWMFENMSTVVDAGESEPTRHRTAPGPSTHRPSPSRRPRPRPEASPAPEPATASAPPPGSVDRDWARALAEDTVWPALRDALQADVHTRLRASDGYDRLVDQLGAKHAAGWSLEALLARLPTEAIGDARDPARYLHAVVQRRAHQSGPAKTGIDRAAMARMVHEAFPADLAAAITERCPAWPKLAAEMSRVEATARVGEPSVVELLRDLPAVAIEHARKPSAYTVALLSRSVAARRGDPLPETALDGSPTRVLDEGAGLAEAAAHQHAADQANRRAVTAEAGAAAHRAAAGDDDVPAPEAAPVAGEPSLDHVGAARVDDTQAAAARAEAAEQQGAASAAALRAQVALTPPASRAAPPNQRSKPTTRVVGKPPMRLTRPHDPKRNQQR